MPKVPLAGPANQEGMCLLSRDAMWLRAANCRRLFYFRPGGPCDNKHSHTAHGFQTSSRRSGVPKSFQKVEQAKRFWQSTLINALLGEGGQITYLLSLVYYWQKNTQSGSTAERKINNMPRLEGGNRDHDCRLLASLELRADIALVLQAKAARSGWRSRNRAQENTARDQAD